MRYVEDLGSGTRNILQYAPLYYEDYKVEVLNGQNFVFSITYADDPENVVTLRLLSENCLPVLA